MPGENGSAASTNSWSFIRHWALPVSPTQPGRGLASPGAWVALALVEPVSASADGGSAGLSSEATGLPSHAPPLPARLPTDGHRANLRGFSLRIAAHGHRWHLG